MAKLRTVVDDIMDNSSTTAGRSSGLIMDDGSLFEQMIAVDKIVDSTATSTTAVLDSPQSEKEDQASR